MDFATLAARFQQAVEVKSLARLSESLGVTTASLARLDIGWSSHHRAWTFPMRGVAEQVLGIRLRAANGRKLSVRNGHEGLFIPSGLDISRQLLIAEGPTDTAALLDLGFSAVGRPSCSGGLKLLVELVQRLRPPAVVIVSDSDPPGKRGAENLARVLAVHTSEVKVIAPPPGVKDARDWKKFGATATQVQAIIDAAPLWKLSIHVERKPAKYGNH